ncbi:RHS repeat-associated core domain-containing protein [Micromonospora rubida]
MAKAFGTVPAAGFDAFSHAGALAGPEANCVSGNNDTWCSTAHLNLSGRPLSLRVLRRQARHRHRRAKLEEAEKWEQEAISKTGVETIMPDVNDLVDVATGDVILAEIDVALPGVLALVLERAHRSSFRAGRWFGRSCMSSLDQRLQVTGERICARFADGETVTWISPGSAGDPPSIPVAGPAWPLRQNPDGSYAISDPQRGLTWQFERRAGYEDDELPLISVTDRIGHEITFSYDAVGRPLSIVHSGGYRVLVSVTDERVTALALAGRDGQADIPLRRFEYDASGNLSGVLNSSDLPRRFTYDGAGRLTGWTDRNGYSYHYTFDSEGRCVRVEGPNGVLSGAFAYEPGITRWTDIDGAVTSYAITECAQVAAITDPIGKTARTEYDERGRVTVHTDPLGRVTRYAYDDRGNLLSVTNPDGRESHVEADEACLPTRITGPDGSLWLQAFDKNGNLTERTAPDGSVLKYGYDSRGHLAEVASADGAVTTMECDPAGMPVTVTKPTGETTRYERDQLGRVVRALSSDGGTTAYAWTTDGLPVSRTLPDGSTESWAWDGEENLLRRISATGSVTSNTYGPFNQLVSIAWPGGTRSELEYDHNCRLTSVIHGGLKWHYELDSAGRLSAQTDYSGATTQYWYDAAGQLVHRVNASGHEASFAYNLLGKLASYHPAEGAVTTFDYDPAGRLVSAKNDDVDLVFVRDSLGRVVTESCNGRAVTKTYDAAGKVASRVTPSGARTAWVYNAAGMPSALTADGRELRFGYDSAGREVQRDLPGGTVLTQEWDQLGRLVTQALTGSAASSSQDGAMVAGQLLQRRAYTYSPDGFVTGLEDLLTGDRAFRLDSAGRVTAVTGRGDGWSEQYDYDPAGNIVNAVWPASATGPAAGTLEMASQGPREIDGTLTTRAGNIRYRYDAAGRVITRMRTRMSGDTDTWRYSWDADSRLFSVALPDGSKWHYQYDPVGRRIGKRHLSSDGQLLEQTQFSWDGGVLAEQEDLRGDSEKVTTWNYLNDSSIPLTQASRTVMRAGSEEGRIDEEFYSVVTDLGGTPVELVSPDGALVGNQQHTLWGQSSWQRDTATTPLRFPGQYCDQETGLHYGNHRYYDPETGVYLSPHPLGLTSASNPHAYVPNSFIASDPLGLLNCEEAAWVKTADKWIGSLFLSHHHLQVYADVDGFDARLFAGGGS